MSEDCGQGTPQGRVLSLCDKSGNALVPWAEAGYECFAVDHDTEERTREVGDGVIHHVKADVRDYEPPAGEWTFAFAWPPCTDLAVSGARWFQEKGLGALAEAIEIVAACVEVLQDIGCPWLLENPKSTLSTYWRSPDHKFDPYEYAHYAKRDESYSKETWLWTSEGFRMPVTDGVPASEADDRIHTMPPGEDRAEKRAETPMGFSRAVFLAFQEPEEYARKPDPTEQKQLVADGGTEGREVERRATCQSCGGDVLLEVDFGDPHTQDACIYAECDGCGKSARLSWEEIPSRSNLGGAESDD